VINENTPLSNALTVVQQAKGMIHELETLLPSSPKIGFRERLVAHLEYLQESARQGYMNLEFRLKANALLIFYEKVFGVKDLVDKPDED